jgi:hypothetical protein
MKGIPAILSPSRIKKCDSMMGEKGFLRQLVGENRFRHLGFRHQRRGGNSVYKFKEAPTEAFSRIWVDYTNVNTNFRVYYE